MAVVVCCDHAFRNRFEGVLRLSFAPAQRYFEAFAVADIPCHGNDRRVPVKFDVGTLRLNPQSVFVAANQLYIESTGIVFSNHHRIVDIARLGRLGQRLVRHSKTPGETPFCCNKPGAD